MAIWLNDNQYYSDEMFLLKLDNSQYCYPHTHDFVEIVYILRGRGIHTVDGNNYPTSRGDLLIINHGCVHSFQSNENMRLFNIIIKPEFIDKNLKGYDNVFSLLDNGQFKEMSDIINKNICFIRFSHEERQQLENLFTWLYQEQETRTYSNNLVIHSYVNIILTLVFRKMTLPVRNESTVNSDLMEYIQKNCELHLTVEHLAEKCSYNPSYFSRLFKQYAGVTFSEFLCDCRLRRACELLLETDLPIEKIIVKSGFSDRTNFFKLFSKKTGTTPLKYRKSKKTILFQDKTVTLK